MTEWMGITVMAFWNKTVYLSREGLKSVFTHGFMSFASITIMLACLTIMGSFSLLSINIQALITQLESDNEMLAFIDESYSEEEALAVEPYILAQNNISDVEFVSRETAMENFKSDYESQELWENIEAEVFRHRYIIHVEDIAYMSETKVALEGVEGVADVSAQLEISQGLVTVRNVVSAISALLIVILFMVSIFIMSNTVKLTTFGRREEIAIMKMVGATNTFIRTPFVIEGLILGIIGSGLAFFAQWGLYSLVCDKLMGSIAGSLVSVIPYEQLMLPVGVSFLGVGVFVGLFGGSIAIRNYLKV